MRIFCKSIYYLLPIILLGSFTRSANAQSMMHVCVQEPIGIRVAIPVAQSCDDLLGSWYELEDVDWTGAGTGAMRTGEPEDRVGIGDVNPRARLHVVYDKTDSEAFIVEPVDGSERTFQITNDGNVILGAQSGANARFTINAGADQEVFRARADGNTALFVGSDGRTGVRISQPRAALHVGSNANEDSLLIEGHDSDDTQLLVNTEGNVGIGLSNPTDKLSVHNSGTGRSGFFLTDNASNIAAALAAVTNGSGSALFGNILNPSSTNATLHAVHSGGGTAGRFEGQLSITRNNHQIEIRDADNSFKTWTLTSHQESNGFGIWEGGQSGQGRLVIESGGDVGIGTTNPETRLHVQGSNDATDMLVRDSVFADMRVVATQPDSDVILTVQARGSANDERAEIGTVSNHDLVLFTNGTPRVVMEAGGTICIGNC